MGTGTLALLSLLPILAVGVFLVGLRWAASRAMPVCYVVAVGLLGKEGFVIRKTLFPFLYYALLVGLVGFAIVWFSWWSENVGLILYSVLVTFVLTTILYAIIRRWARGKMF